MMFRALWRGTHIYILSLLDEDAELVGGLSEFDQFDEHPPAAHETRQRVRGSIQL
jgi:hypothetical protein